MKISLPSDAKCLDWEHVSLLLYPLLTANSMIKLYLIQFYHQITRMGEEKTKQEAFSQLWLFLRVIPKGHESYNGTFHTGRFVEHDFFENLDSAGDALLSSRIPILTVGACAVIQQRFFLRWEFINPCLKRPY